MPNAAEPPPREPEDREPKQLSDHLKLYLSEPTLWPVTLVLAIVLVTVGTTALVAALERNLPAIGAVALLAGLSLDPCVREVRRGGPGAVTGLVAAFWLLSALGAWLVRAHGWV